ncbi:hypothetical protein [Nonomuraea gerenzanensis]|uniref:hypothetical protein n=1 Tax=Nonomuraea gerenzanensis TaxID=93944 RepID=UPI001CDA49BD|nr:hypothetical protein [Nonomuraea gerenzanensis]UBU15938.1 hypothetical protein LCN96_13290 [Nonomuraea gerenzanensis]
MSRCTSSPSTTIDGSARIRRAITPDTASMNLRSASSPVNVSRSAVRTPSSSDRSPRTPTCAKPGEPSASLGPVPGKRWVYFLAPWGMQFELVSYPGAFGRAGA